MAATEFAKKATHGYAWNYLYKLSEFGLTNLYTILVVRQFGPEISAPYAVFLSLAAILSMVGAFGVDGVLLRFIQRIISNEHTSEPESFDKIETLRLPHFITTLLAFRMLIISAVSLLVACVFLVLPIWVPSLQRSFGALQLYSPHLILFLIAQGLSAFSTFALTGLLETKKVFLSSIISRSALLLIGIALIVTGNLTLTTAITLYTGSFCLSAVLMYSSLRMHVSIHSGSVSHLSSTTIFRAIRSFLTRPRHILSFLATPLLVYGITTWGNDLLSTVLGKQPDILMMRAILGEHSSQIGLYYSAAQILMVTEYIFLFGLGGTLVSIFSKLAHQDESEGNGYPALTKARQEIAGFQSIVLLPLCTFVFLFIDSIIALLLGPSFSSAAIMVQIGIVSLIISVGGFGGGMQITSLVSAGKERIVFKNRLFWGILNLIINVVLITFFGGLGAIIGTQYCNAAACGTEAYFSRKYIGKAINLPSTTRLLVLSFTASALAMLVCNVIGVSEIIRLILGGSLNIALILLFYKIFSVPELQILHRRLENLSPKLANRLR